VRKHEEYKEMIVAHALLSLERAEARELDAHLAACAECRAELDAWQETGALLVHAAPYAEPSSAVRSRIFASIRTESVAKKTSPAFVAEEEKVKGREISSSSRAESNVVPFEQPQAWRSFGTAFKLGALAASVAFIALAVSLVLLWNRYNAMQQQMTRVSDQLTEAQSELRNEREQLARERQAKELIAAPETRITTLAGTELATRARAKFVYDRKTGRAMLMADDLPPAPAGKAYQLWFIEEGKPPMPGHVFNPDSDGHVEMVEQLPLEARGANLFAVTLEPSSGVDAPTGAKYLLGAAAL
jgi:anti-sigma-K factor RskA